MPGGRGKINEYNKSLTPEQRKNNAKKAASAKRPNMTLNCDIRRIARMINEMPACPKLKNELEITFCVKDNTLSNAAGIVLAVYQAAINGDMRAVEKWEKYVGQHEETVSVDEIAEDGLSQSLREMAESLESDDDI